MMVLGRALALTLLLTGLASVQGCVYLYGSRYPAVPNATHYSYAYAGLDWPEEFPVSCAGTHQSPINVPGHTALTRLTDDDASLFTFGKITSNGSNIQLINNGHTVQVKTPSDWRPDASVVYKGPAASATLTSKFSNATATPGRVKIRPAQFHFHTRSEHVIGGKEYPLEMHIVNYVYNDSLAACGTGGCIAVVGILLELADNDTATPNPFVDAVFSQMPSYENSTVPLPANITLDFDQVLPADRSYITYEGSLTTPPCTESILWHVLTTPVQITKAQLHQFELAVGEVDCNTTNSTASQSGRKLFDTSAFEQPAWALDPVGNLTCHKIVGQNYREVQDVNSRPVYFYAGQGVCDAQLSRLIGSSKQLGNLLYPSGNNKTMTLAQYDAVAAASMTKTAGCAGLANAADVHAVSGSMLQLLVLAFASVMVLLGI